MLEESGPAEEEEEEEEVPLLDAGVNGVFVPVE